MGSNAEIRTRGPAGARTIDLASRTVLPGLIDAHGHMAALGDYGLGRLDLADAGSLDDVVRIVAARARAAQPGTWTLGGRWDHESWPEHKLPTHETLSAVSPDNPVWLIRVGGHAGLANAAAMKRAAVTGETASPTGGRMVRNPDGKPSGVFLDNAQSRIDKQVPDPSADPAEAILTARKICLSTGLTGVRDAGISPYPIKLYPSLADFGKLRLRIYSPLSGAAAIDYFSRNKPIIGDLFTLDAAYAAFEEDLKGPLQPGKPADFIVIDRDVMTSDLNEIPATRVLQTFVGGKAAYRSKQSRRRKVRSDAEDGPSQYEFQSRIPKQWFPDVACDQTLALWRS